MKRTGSLGKISFERPVTDEDIGVRTGSDSELVMAYLDWAEGYAEYWLQMKNGAILLQMIPGSPESGAIYILNGVNRTFYLVAFEHGDSTLTKRQFEDLVSEYRLLDYASHPHLIDAMVQEPATA
jgi:hypothetical protein